MEIKELGIISMLLGIIGFFSIFIFGLLASIPLGIIAIILGNKPRKQGNLHGKYGVILGFITIIVTVLLSSFVFLYLG